MSKRKRFIITSASLSLGFVILQLLPEQYRFGSIAALGILTLALFIWSLREGLGFDMTLLTLVLPVAFTVGVGLFWFLLPSNIFAKIPIVIICAFIIYALCLTMNIYTVAAIRTIALLRAARGVGFVLTLIVFFLIFDTVLSLKAPLYLTSPAAVLISVPLFFQGFWSAVLDKSFSLEIMKISLVSSLIIGEIALGIYFWPVTITVGSIFLTVAVYELLGLGQAKLEGRLFAQTVREYFFLGIAVFVGMFLATHWGG